MASYFTWRRILRQLLCIHKLTIIIFIIHVHIKLGFVWFCNPRYIPGNQSDGAKKASCQLLNDNLLVTTLHTRDDIMMTFHPIMGSR